MTVPFMKNKEGSMSGPVEHKSMSTDEDHEYGMLDAVAEDMMSAFHSKNHKMLKMALESLIDHIKSEDEQQDEGETHGE